MARFNIYQPRRPRTAKVGPAMGGMRRDRRYDAARARGRTTRPRSSVRMPVAVGCALTIVASGPSNAASRPTASGTSEQGVKYAGCMRPGGSRTSPTRAQAEGGGGEIPVSSGISSQSPVFKSAREAGVSVLPAAVGGSELQNNGGLITRDSKHHRPHLQPSSARPPFAASAAEGRGDAT